MSKCVICGKVIRGKHKQFTTGQWICEKHLKEFNTQIESQIDNNVLVENILRDSVNDIQEYINQCLQERLQQINYDIDPNDSKELDKNVECLFSEENLKEYNEIILKNKNRHDLFNRIDFSQISFNTELFQNYFSTKIQEQSLKYLQDSSFYLMHRQLLDLIPKTKDGIDWMFNNGVYDYLDKQTTLFPFITICRIGETARCISVIT